MNRKEMGLIALCGILAIVAIVGWSREHQTEPANAAVYPASTQPAVQAQPVASQPYYGQPATTAQTYPQQAYPLANGQPMNGQTGMSQAAAGLPQMASGFENSYIPSDAQPVMIAPAMPVSANYSANFTEADRYAPAAGVAPAPQAVYQTDGRSGVRYVDRDREYRREGDRSTGKSVAIVAGTAAGGALIGGLAGGGKGAAIGAASGAGAGFIYDRATRHHRRHFWF